MNITRNVSIFALGLVFGAGLLVSGLTRPSVIVGALDITGRWDPRMWVAVAVSIAVFLPARLLILRRRTPVLARCFPGKAAKTLDARLFVGASIFGLGWGLCGSCPGQSVTALLGAPQTMLFVASLLVGMTLFRAYDALADRARSRVPVPTRG